MFKYYVYDTIYHKQVDIMQKFIDEPSMKARITKEMHTSFGKNYTCIAYSYKRSSTGLVEGRVIFKRVAPELKNGYDYGYCTYYDWAKHVDVSQRKRGIGFNWGHYMYPNLTDVFKDASKN